MQHEQGKGLGEIGQHLGGVSRENIGYKKTSAFRKLRELGTNEKIKRLMKN